MHMADALISPAVGVSMWTAAAATTAYCAKRVRADDDAMNVPLMGVMGAFTFAAQMVNFSIPGTGSSGHIGGGLLLAILLGPEAAFLVIASVLTVQALFFADGGLLALGANIVNLGVFPAFVAYPFVYRAVAGRSKGRARMVAGAVLAAALGVTLGALGVVTQTALSGVSTLPFAAFSSVMLPIHLAIGVVEGAVTAAVISFVARAQPEMLLDAPAGRGTRPPATRALIATFAVAALLAGGASSYIASERPDGLEWSIAGVAGTPDRGESQESDTPAARLQEGIAFMRDYRVASVPDDSAGTGIAGLAGSAITLALVAGTVWLVGRRSSRRHRD